MKKIFTIIFFSFCLLSAFSQTDSTAYKTDHRREVKSVRAGNRAYKKENYRKSEVDYRKSLLFDSLSVAGNYNLAAALYKQGDAQAALGAMEPIASKVKGTETEAAYDFNKGDYCLDTKDYAGAVEAFKQALLLNPGDKETRENYQYAKKMLENQQNQQNQNDQNQENNDQNQDQNQNQDNQPQQDDNKQDNQQPQQNDNQQQQSQSQQQLSKQQAEAMLQAINEDEKKTKEEVDKKKAQAVKDAQKIKNW